MSKHSRRTITRLCFPVCPAILVLILASFVEVVAVAQALDIDQISADLKTRSQELDALTQQLDSANISDDRLSRYLRTLVEYDAETNREVAALDKALGEPKNRLEILGPAPGEGEPPEPSDLASLRAQLTGKVAQLTGLSREARLNKAVIGELIDRIDLRRREQLLTNLRGRGHSALSAALWSQAAAQVQPARIALKGFYAAGRWKRLGGQGGKADLALLVMALAMALAMLLLPRWGGWRRFETKLVEDPDPSPLAKRRVVAFESLSRAALVLSASGLLYLAGTEAEIITPSDQDLAARICFGAAAWALVHRFARGFFSPAAPAWRIARCDERSARLLAVFLVTAFSVFLVDRLSSLVLAQVDTGAELTTAASVLTTTLFASSLWLTLSGRLWRKGAPSDEPLSWAWESLRRAGRFVAVALIVLPALGYAPLATFAFHRLSLLFVFLLLLWCVHTLALWGLSKLPTNPRPAKSGEAEGDKSQGQSEAPARLSFWLRVGLDLNLLLAAVPGFLLVVGFDWLEVRRVFDWLGSDFHLGKLALSFPDLLTAVIVFFFVSAGTRWVTAMTQRRVLKHRVSEADAQSSVATLINYFGLFVAFLIALPIAGIGFAKLALIAGGLSVGIGFGLQTIANNFVSGLILLFERPIRPGDWVVVASGEGYVKSIGARSTEISTFDGSSIIIPNAELVSSSLQNWFHGNRVGRIRVSVGVAYDSDPRRVKDILLQCAGEQDSIMPYPAPLVVFEDFGDSSLNFELRAFLRNYDIAARVRSDLRFAIFEAFDKAGIVMPFPQRDVHLYTEPVAQSRESEGEK